MKKKLYAILLTIIFSQVGFLAYAAPVNCPSVSAIQTVGLNYVHLDEDGKWYVAYKPSNKYDTSTDWLFMLGSSSPDDNAKDEADALEKGNAALNALQIYDDKNCLYYSTNGSFITGAAISPPPTVLSLAMILSQH